MYIKHHKTKDTVIVSKHNENKNIRNFDIKPNAKSYENIKNIVLEKYKK